MGHPIQHHQPGKCLFQSNRTISLLRFAQNFYSFFISEGEQIIIPRTLTSEVLAAIQSVRFIAQHIKDSDRDNEVSRFCDSCGKNNNSCKNL